MTTLDGIVRRGAHTFPDRTAVIDARVEWSWRDFDREVNRSAAALRALGVGPGDRVAAADYNSAAYFALYYGAALSQEEIGKSLAMPQRTVSLRIKQLLETLRANFSKAGITTASLALTPEGLKEAVCAGLEMPPGFHEKVVGQILSAGSPSLGSASQRAHPFTPSARSTPLVASSHAGFWAAGLAVAALAGGAVLSALERSGATLPSPRPRFAHGAEARIGERLLLGSYHVRQQNTHPGRLRPAIFPRVLARARRAIEE